MMERHETRGESTGFSKLGDASSRMRAHLLRETHSDVTFTYDTPSYASLYDRSLYTTVVVNL